MRSINDFTYAFSSIALAAFLYTVKYEYMIMYVGLWYINSRENGRTIVSTLYACLKYTHKYVGCTIIITTVHSYRIIGNDLHDNLSFHSHTFG